MREYLVKASPKIRVANMVLKTSPDYIPSSARLDWETEAETDRLESREHRERKCRNLDRTPHDVRYDEHQHSQLYGKSVLLTDLWYLNAHLPSPTLVRRPS